MKKLLLLFSVILLTGSVIANDSPVFEWGAYIKASGTSDKTASSPSTIKKNNQKELFAFGSFGSHTTLGLDVLYRLVPYDATNAPEVSAIGAPYTGNSVNNNFFLYKTDEDGKLLWQVTSNMGDVASGNSAMVPTNDGGAFLALKVRHTNNNENTNNTLLGIVANNGTVINVEWTYPGFSAYQGVLVKISATGDVEWAKKIDISTDVRPNFTTAKTSIVDGFSFYDLAVDENNNLYLGGYYLNEITFGTKTLVPHNGDGWNGDTQTARNDLFLVKLSSQGEYVWDVVTTGKVKNETVKSISYDNGSVYLYGNLQGDDALTLNLGSYTAIPTARADAYTAKVKADDGSVEWFKHLKSVGNNGGASRIKITNVQYSNGVLISSGSFTGLINEANGVLIKANTNGTLLQGFALAQNALTGEVQNVAIAPISGISEFSRGFYVNEKFHLVGYNMSQGQYYISCDKDMANESAPFILMNAGSPTSYDACLVDNSLISFGRGRGNVSFTNSTETVSFSAYSSVLSSYIVYGLDETGVGNDTYKNDINAYSANGLVIANFEGVANVNLYSVDGRLIDKTTVEGTYSKSVEKGVYILLVNNSSFKLIVK